jgi:hypothetical protein
MATPPIRFIGRLDIAIKAAGVAIVSVNSNGIVSPENLQAAANPVIAAFDDSDAAHLDFANNKARNEANNDIDNNKAGLYKSLRAEAKLIVNEINILRQWIVGFKVEVAAATSLADLKTRVATLPNLPDRTFEQAKTAMKNEVMAGSVD